MLRSLVLAQYNCNTIFNSGIAGAGEPTPIPKHNTAPADKPVEDIRFCASRAGGAVVVTLLLHSRDNVAAQCEAAMVDAGAGNHYLITLQHA